MDKYCIIKSLCEELKVPYSYHLVNRVNDDFNDLVEKYFKERDFAQIRFSRSMLKKVNDRKKFMYGCYKYLLPKDCFFVSRVSPQMVVYKIEDIKLITDFTSDIFVSYIKNTNPNVTGFLSELKEIISERLTD